MSESCMKRLRLLLFNLSTLTVRATNVELRFDSEMTHTRHHFKSIGMWILSNFFLGPLRGVMLPHWEDYPSQRCGLLLQSLGSHYERVGLVVCDYASETTILSVSSSFSAAARASSIV